MLKQQISDDLKTAMREKNTTAVSTLRMLNSAIKYFEIDQGTEYEATDDDIVSIVQKEIKKRNDAITLYKKGNREELAQKEEEEKKVLEAYVPEQLDEEAITRLVHDAIKQSKATDIKDMGTVMGIVMKKSNGNADGSIVSTIVRQELATLRR